MRQKPSGIMMHEDVLHARLFDYAVVVSDSDNLHIKRKWPSRTNTFDDAHQDWRRTGYRTQNAE